MRLFQVALAVFFVAQFSHAQCTNPATLPTGLNSFFVVTADGSYNDPTQTEPPHGGAFDVMMGRTTQTQVYARQQEAIDFFNTRFAVDFSHPNSSPAGSAVEVDLNGDSNLEVVTADGKFKLQYYMVDSRWSQRVVYSGNQIVDTSGWTIHEAYYAMVALVDGAEIAGTYLTSPEVQASVQGVMPAPTSLPVISGTFAAHGEYRIAQAGCHAGNIDMNYESIRPTYPDVFNASLGMSPRGAFDYTVTFDPDTGPTGFARGRAELQNLGGGNFQAYVRNVIKISP